MANNPVQVVMNTQNYIDYQEKQAGGGNTDFYAGRDELFKQHKETLVGQLTDIKSSVAKDETDSLLFVKVSLQSNAIAKSHRPLQKVFDLKKSEYLGGDKLGSMLIEMPAGEIDKISKNISSAEEETNWETRSGKQVPKPSRVRSEVGAIESIKKYSAVDRRKFSIEKARDWLLNPETGGSYYVETLLSESDIEERQDGKIKNLENIELKLFREKLKDINLPVTISEIDEDFIRSNILVIKVNDESMSDIQIHETLLTFLENEKLVKSILLPPILQSEYVANNNEETIEITTPGDGEYPIVGIIDTGVAPLENLEAWRAGSSDYLTSEKQDHSHGTFIAGLVTHSDAFNSYEQLQEEKCKFYDLGLHPTEDEKYADYYPRGFVDFLVQLDFEIKEAKNLGVRIFNMSLSVETPVVDNNYSLFASTIDNLAEKHDVIFVLPAGNLDGSIVRDKWPDDKVKVLEMLASYQHQGQDRIFQPADSISSMVVGALDPPKENSSLRPARYTRRGPGPAQGSKPDVAHIGGEFDDQSGLKSISKTGESVEACGTSYAAPLVAKTLTVINSRIEGTIPKEALKALVLHETTIPESINGDELSSIRKDFIGAGLPKLANDCLTVEDYEISLIFNGILLNKNALDFQFSWPESLVNDMGKCKGDVKVTMVYDPPTDEKFGAEFVRVNLDVHLRQEIINKDTGEVTFRGALTGEEHKNFEKELVAHGAKWWPIKTKKGSFTRKGSSSQWKLIVEPLVRANYIFPDEGVPFSVVLTIKDKDRTAPVFTEMRAQLQNQGVEISDVRTALTTRVR